MTGKPSMRPACVYTQASRSGELCRCALYSRPFDTAFRAHSGQAVNLQEATREPDIRVAEYCLVIS